VFSPPQEEQKHPEVAEDDAGAAGAGNPMQVTYIQLSAFTGYKYVIPDIAPFMES
jgi:hypothetical protein